MRSVGEKQDSATNPKLFARSAPAAASRKGAFSSTAGFMLIMAFALRVLRGILVHKKSYSW